MTKNRNENGIQNTKKGEFSYNQIALGNSFVGAAPWSFSVSVSLCPCVSLCLPPPRFSLPLSLPLSLPPHSNLGQEAGSTALTPRSESETRVKHVNFT